MVPEDFLEVFLRKRDSEPRSGDSKLSPLRESLSFSGAVWGQSTFVQGSGKILAAELAEQEENRETTVTKLLLNRNLEKLQDPVTSVW